MSSAEPPLAEGSTSSNQHRRPRRRPNKPRENALSTTVIGVDAQGVGATQGDHRERRPPRPPRLPNEGRNSVDPAERPAQQRRQHRPPQKKDERSPAPLSDAKDHQGPSRRARFQGKLSSTTEPIEKRGDSAPQRTNLPQGDDLTSSLIRSVSTAPYPDCPICFVGIHPAQPTWACSPETPVIPSSEGQVHCCWTLFHTKCIKAWAGKSAKEVAEAWRARGEHDKVGDWRCPGCQAKREVVPSGYWCFCNAVPEPMLTRLSTPHSCGKPCSRVRDSGCGHPCTLLCHPGPCPPCQVVTQLECYCPRHISISFRCGADIGEKGKRDLSCGNTCGRLLKCEKHSCDAICHDGECQKCPLTEVVKCYCGKEEEELACGDGTPSDCFVEGEAPWIGRYSCDSECQRPFDCGIHHCTKPCHPPSSRPEVCPSSPSKVLSCPCGKNLIAPPNASDPVQYTFPARVSCESPIPTCSYPCGKPHTSCSHPCEANCHSGACPPCNVMITRPCRCGSSTKRISCHDAFTTTDDGDVAETEIICDRPCLALRACGRHECRRICCPLASLAISNRKGKKRVTPQNEAGIGEERGGLHECDLVCSKLLSCGNHRCEERDHKGPCPPCLRSSFEELPCPCGRTVFEPPIPCGTQIQCSYPCHRPAPPCGHAKVPHSCHHDSLACPPCPHLTPKWCACGKKELLNVKCSLENDKVSCGSVCGKLMTCGFHHCESSCHSGDCGSCTAPCGKSRKLCLPNYHPCTRPCHAPAACPENDLCEATMSVNCACGRITQAVKCGRHSAHPAGHQVTPPKCTTECGIAKRNAKLAEALGINPDLRDKDKGVTYNDEVLAFARANPKFLPVVEKAFEEFVSSDKRIKVLPHMPPEKRKFVHDLASVYRMDTQLIDQEPRRSVQLIRRVDTRIPTPVLSGHLASLAPAPNFGRLADLRTIRGISSSPQWSPKPSSSGSRGWASTASRPTRTVAGAATTAAPAPVASISLAARPTAPTVPRNRSRTDVPSAQEEEQKPVTDNWEDDL